MIISNFIKNNDSQNKKTIAFDAYGTLINVASISSKLHRLVHEKTSAFSSIWRSKQLEYSFRRGLMKNYVDFNICTRQALDYTHYLEMQELAKAKFESYQ